VTLLLCDLDDTLVDRGRVFGLWAADFVQAHGLTAEDLRWVTVLDDCGITTREHFWSRIRLRFSLPQPVEDLVAEWAVDFPSRYRCDAGVLDQLGEAHSRGWSLGVITNGDAHVQARKLAAAELDLVVDSICISGADGVRKPDRRIFALAADRAGVPLESGWMTATTRTPTSPVRAASAYGRCGSAAVAHGPSPTFGPTTRHLIPRQRPGGYSTRSRQRANRG